MLQVKYHRAIGTIGFTEAAVYALTRKKGYFGTGLL
jgi:hypothetical protein